MHENHRSRMKHKLLSFGEGVFCDHELLEMLLFFSLPRVNTNQYAHELIDRFGSLDGVFEASISDIVDIKGIGFNSAVLIKLVAGLMKRRSAKTISKRQRMSSLSVTSEYIVNLFSSGNEESLYMVTLDNSLGVIDAACIISGTVNYSSATVAEIIKRAVKTNAASVILAHNHPKGLAIPSTIDIEATHRINDGLRYAGISLIDHFVVNGKRCNSIIHASEDYDKQVLDLSTHK